MLQIRKEQLAGIILTHNKVQENTINALTAQQGWSETETINASNESFQNTRDNGCAKAHKEITSSVKLECELTNYLNPFRMVCSSLPLCISVYLPTLLITHLHVSGKIVKPILQPAKSLPRDNTSLSSTSLNVFH